MNKYLLAGGLSAVLILGACGTEEEPEQEAEADTTESAEEQTEEATEEQTEEATEEQTVERNENSDELKEMENGKFEIQMAEVKINDTEILPPGEYSDSGKDRLVVHYEVTSKVTPEEAGETSVTPTHVWMASVEATQETPDTIKSLDVGVTPREEKYSKYTDTQTSTIKKGKTVENITVYELENQDNPVSLKASQGIDGEELGQMEIDVTE